MITVTKEEIRINKGWLIEHGELTTYWLWIFPVYRSYKTISITS